MALSFVRYASTGTSGGYGVPFPYLDPKHVHMSVNGIEVACTVTLFGMAIPAVAPPAGALVKIWRQTPSGPLVSFTLGDLDPKDLNTSALQALYLAQEANDAAADSVQRREDTVALDARNMRVTKLAAGTESSDAVTKAQLDQTGSVAAQATASEASTRAAADTALTAAIAQETAQRIAAVSSEAAQRHSGDQGLSAAIDNEASVRAQADTLEAHNRSVGDINLSSLIATAGPSEAPDYASFNAAQSANIAPSRTYFRTAGYELPGDPGAAVYKLKNAQEPGAFPMPAISRWAVLTKDALNVCMFGVREVATPAANKAAFQDAVDYVTSQAPRRRLEVPEGTFTMDGPILITRPIAIVGRGRDTSRLQLAVGSVGLFDIRHSVTDDRRPYTFRDLHLLSEVNYGYGIAMTQLGTETDRRGPVNWDISSVQFGRPMSFDATDHAYPCALSPAIRLQGSEPDALIGSGRIVGCKFYGDVDITHVNGTLRVRDNDFMPYYTGVAALRVSNSKGRLVIQGNDIRATNGTITLTNVDGASIVDNVLAQEIDPPVTQFTVVGDDQGLINLNDCRNTAVDDNLIRPRFGRSVVFAATASPGSTTLVRSSGPLPAVGYVLRGDPAYENCVVTAVDGNTITVSAPIQGNVNREVTAFKALASNKAAPYALRIAGTQSADISVRDNQIEKGRYAHVSVATAVSGPILFGGGGKADLIIALEPAARRFMRGVWCPIRFSKGLAAPGTYVPRFICTEDGTVKLYGRCADLMVNDAFIIWELHNAMVQSTQFICPCVDANNAAGTAIVEVTDNITLKSVAPSLVAPFTIDLAPIQFPTIGAWRWSA